MPEQKPEKFHKNVASTLFAAHSEDSKPSRSSALSEFGDWLPEPSFFRAQAANPLVWKGAAAVGVVFVGMLLWPTVSAAVSAGTESVSTAWNEARNSFSEAAPDIPGVSQFTSERAMYRLAADFSAAEKLEIAGETYLLDARTASLEDYRLDLQVDLADGPASWIVRAANADNYYAFRLQAGRRSTDPFQLTRHAVVAGEETQEEPVTVEVPVGLITDDAAQVSVVLRGHTITTLVNGQGVDFWRELNLRRGGVAVQAEGSVRDAVVRGNEDDWGKFLYRARAAFETLGERIG